MANPHEAKVYNVIDDTGELVMTGTANEIAEQFFMDPSTIRHCGKAHIKLLKEFTIEDTGEMKHV